MQNDSEKFLEALINAPSPSGFEEPAQLIVQDRMSAYCDSVSSDVHGNVIGVVNPSGKLRVMLAGHVDQIGLMITHITDDGYLYFASIGGVDEAIVPTQRVLVHSASGPVPGVIGKKAIHLMSPEDRKKVSEMKTLFIDIGVSSRKNAEKLVAVSDPVTFVAPYQRLSGDIVAGGGFDDRVGSFVVAETLRLLSTRKPKAAVFGVSTVQEELGLRGARTSAFGIDPHAGIAIDVTFASDYPGAEKATCGEVKLGKGPVLHRGANINSVLGSLMVATARKKRIPFQFAGEPRATGTDANAIQLNRAGVAAALISIPNRYMHTPVEVVSLRDLDNAPRLIAETILAMSEKTDFRPLLAHQSRNKKTASRRREKG
jgi:endoglucanase